MKLPIPRTSYSMAAEIDRNGVLERADAQNFKRGRDIEVGSGRLILTGDSGTRYEVYIDASGELRTREVETGLDVSAGLIAHAEQVVYSTYGDTVSVSAKKKDLTKFGRNRTVGTSYELVAELQSTESTETFVSTNLIDSISSSSGSDTTQTIYIEGHTIDGSGNLTFATQTAALNGQTKVTLTTPLARATRAYVYRSGTFNSTPAALVGTVYIYDDTDGITSGVPNTAAASKLLILAGETQSEKCGTSISSTDYWFITEFSAAIGGSGGAANRVTLRTETRDVANGGAWRPTGRDIILVVGGPGRTITYDPLLIVPKNHDVRVVAKSNASTAEVTAHLQGVLAAIQ